MPDFDIAVCGVGAMGSAALYHLARRGLRVVGIDRATPGHDGGSSHGLTRMIRLSYFEHPSYVPLLRRAYALWHDLEQAVGRSLLHRTGILEIGPAGGPLVSSTLAAARLHGLPHEILGAHALMTRYPAFQVPTNYVAVLQPDGGFVEAAAAIAAHLALATANGAELRIGETIAAIEPRRDGVRIVTDRGAIDSGTAIVAAGPWATKLLPDARLPLRVTRQVLGWFKPLDAALFANGRCPMFLLETRHGLHYGIPLAAEPGLKFAKHHHAEETVDPDACDRTVSARDEALIRAALAEHLPAANGPMVAANTCLYTMTPDGDFIIDRLPNAPRVIVTSPCSGHGFKFAPMIGEILCDLVSTGSTAHDISRFRLSRFED
ncbi:MAG: N-methyl-L-tryptophan oxidase [Rhizobiales bacterium]|nr:N-methyl-L-tryptophan oxidase [Hyphomicrobiales bacterium]